jgi:predicted ATP-dependent serine protease
MKNKKDSYMGDVGLPGKIDDISELKEKLIEAFHAKAHKAISRYSRFWRRTF